ncbi:hypothetical protein L1887_23762 [Cichorium endivia]|nr:hypothetical protein L1887_23762 [Cichorium endivia]
MLPRQQPSGAQNRKRKKREQEMANSLRGSLNKYFVRNQNTNENNTNPVDSLNDFENNTNPVDSLNDFENNTNLVDNTNDPIDISKDFENNEFVDKDKPSDFNIFDPRVWDELDSKMKDLLIEKGPNREIETNTIFPKDAFGRHFSNDFFIRKLINGDVFDRKWLVYSKELDKVFCFCCKLFKTVRTKSKLAFEGLNDWKHLSERLRQHENSSDHMINLRTWTETRIRLNKCETIDKELQEMIKKDTEHWKDVMVRIIAVVKCLAKNNLAFRGTNEKIYEESNGNFLSVLECIADFDIVMKKHFPLIQDKETHKHYLSHKIQNELIEMLASEVKSEIIKKVKESKYFSIILDCTPDASRQEQMTLIIRCVDMVNIPIKVEEFFLEFIIVEDTSGLGLLNALQDALKSLDLNINNVRGQGYDNGANMKGKHHGVQKRLLDINPRAFYMPCGCHSLNLVLCDMANSCHKAKTFFGTCQTIYNVFSSSTKRWSILLKYIDELTLKSLSATRWESHIESVKAIKTQFPQIRKALKKLAKISEDGKVVRDAESLVNGEFSSFEFILSLIIWYEILYRINLVSKKLQSKDMLIDVAVKNLEGLINFFEEYREIGFDKAIIEAKEIAMNIEIEPEFPKKRISNRKKQFDEIPNTEREHQSLQEAFRKDYFIVLVDMTLSQLRTRFEQMKYFESIFGFLFDGSKLISLLDDELKKCCLNLESNLTNGEEVDIDGEGLFIELQLLQKMLSGEAYKGESPWTSIQIMEFARRMDMFPNVLVAYKILLTVPVTVASGGKKFFKIEAFEIIFT